MKPDFDLTKLIRKTYTSDVDEKSIDAEKRTLTAYVSTNAIDRMKEVLEPSGAELKHYNKNPVVLWAHDYEQAPIGRAVWIKRDAKGLIAKVEFAPTERGQEVFELYKGGFMRAFSVGFIPSETETPEKDKGPRRIFKRWELLEFSAVPVPANPEALMLAVQKGIVKDDTIIEAMQKEMDGPEDEEEEEDDFVGLEDLQAENIILKEQLQAKEAENLDLKFKLFELSESTLIKLSEITADELESKALEIVRGVIRKHQGKLD